MFAIIKALAAAILIAEIAGGFALGFATLVLLGLHVSGIAFWTLEALIAAVVTYISVLFFLRALAFERAEAKAGQ